MIEYIDLWKTAIKDKKRMSYIVVGKGIEIGVLYIDKRKNRLTSITLITQN